VSRVSRVSRASRVSRVSRASRASRVSGRNIPQTAVHDAAGDNVISLHPPPALGRPAGPVPTAASVARSLTWSALLSCRHGRRVHCEPVLREATARLPVERRAAQGAGGAASRPAFRCAPRRCARAARCSLSAGAQARPPSDGIRRGPALCARAHKVQGR
jgi:hypothetical protein